MTQQFAYTGPSPKEGYVGFINISETELGVRFLVRSEGDNPPTASYDVPKDEATKLLADALNGISGADGWLPIETAPKRKLVLLASDHHPTTVGIFEYGSWLYAFAATEGGDSPRYWQPLPKHPSAALHPTQQPPHAGE